jgi:hypothetical protein
MFEHGVEDSEQLAHGGNQRDFGRFTALTQALIKSTQCRLMTDRGEGRHIERSPHLCTTAEDRARAAPRSALAAEKIGEEEQLAINPSCAGQSTNQLPSPTPSTETG